MCNTRDQWSWTSLPCRYRGDVLFDGIPTSSPTSIRARPPSGSTPSTPSSTSAAGPAPASCSEAPRAGAEQSGRLPGDGLDPLHQHDPADEEPWFPGDEYLERRIRAYIRWNAAVMVDAGEPPLRRHRRAPLDVRQLGRALRGRLQPLLPRQGRRRLRRPGLLPGSRLARHLRPRVPRGPARRGAARPLPPRGLRRRAAELPAPAAACPTFWEYPTVSMGLGPLNAIYQARFNRYL